MHAWSTKAHKINVFLARILARIKKKVKSPARILARMVTEMAYIRRLRLHALV